MCVVHCTDNSVVTLSGYSNSTTCDFPDTSIKILCYINRKHNQAALFFFSELAAYIYKVVQTRLTHTVCLCRCMITQSMSLQRTANKSGNQLVSCCCDPWKDCRDYAILFSAHPRGKPILPDIPSKTPFTCKPPMTFNLWPCSASCTRVGSHITLL